MAPSRGDTPPNRSTICLPFDQRDYDRLVHSPAEFRRALDRFFRDAPELFPEGFGEGYRLKDSRTSAKLGLRIRRVRIKATGAVFSVRPSFAMPYLADLAADAELALFLRRFGVPFWAVAEVCGKDAMHWYRLEVSLGRNSVAGTTARKVELPKDLVADEHHQTRDGDKVYVATVVGGGCCLGAAVVDTCDEVGLAEGYGTFRDEAKDIDPGYSPRTVNADGWAATRNAWAGLFPMAVIVRCFLHGWLSIRDGCKKHLRFAELSEKVWYAFRAADRRSFGQRLRRVREWVTRELTGEIRERALRLCGRGAEYGEAYAHPGCHRTSNMLDRVMRGMCGYFDGGLHLHGAPETSDLHARAWALLFNFGPWCPASVRSNGGRRSPAERLNGHRYHDSWLQNLLVSASLGGFHGKNNPPQNP